MFEKYRIREERKGNGGGIRLKAEGRGKETSWALNWFGLFWLLACLLDC